MTNNPGASFGGKPEEKVGGIIVPQTLAEQKKALSKEINLLAENKAQVESVPASSPDPDFDKFKMESRMKNIREATANILYKQPDVAAEMAATSQTFNQAVSDKKLSWKQAANDPALISLVKYSTGLEKTAITPTSTIVVPEMAKLRGQPTTSLDARTEGDLRLKRDGSIEDKFILRPGGNVKKQEGSIDFTETKKEDFKTIAQEYNQAIESSQNSGLVVNNFTAEEQAAKKAEWLKNNPQADAPDQVLMRKDAPLDVDLAEMEKDVAANELIAKLDTRNAERAAKETGGVTVNNFSAEEQAAKKAEWLKNNPQANEPDEIFIRRDTPVDIDLSEMEKDADKNLSMPLDINLDVSAAEANKVKAPEVLPKVIRPVEEQKPLVENLKNGVDAAPANMDQAQKRLNERQLGSLARLNAMGVKEPSANFAKIKGFLKRNQKLALGVALAGASVATGGATSVLSGMFSAASYSSGFYDKMLKAEQAKNPDVKKGWIAARATLYGIVAAAATTALIGHYTGQIDIGDHIDAVKEKMSSMGDTVRSFISSFGEGSVAVPPDPTIIGGLDLPPEIPINPLDLPSQVQAPATVIPQEPIGPPVGGPITPDVVAPTSSVPIDVPVTQSPVATIDNLDGNVTGVGVPDNLPTQSDLDGNVTGTGTPNNIQTVDNLDGNVTGQGVPNNIPQQPAGGLVDSSGNPILSGSGGTVSTGGIADNRP